jgi:Na+-translocating ferredoxin:NAD+ oxidoreductase subunit D
VSAAGAAAPHLRAERSVARVMELVLLALLPYALVHLWLYGPVLPLQLAVAVVAAGGAEALALRLRRRDPRAALRDRSVLVTAALLAAALPPFLPWWITALAAVVAVLLGKHAFGGLGQNPFNPAMVGYATVLLAFPLQMTRWTLPATALAQDWGTLARTGLATVLGRADPAAIDGWTGATALEALQSGLAQRLTMQEIRALPAFGGVGGAGVEWLALAALLGGLALLALRIVRWQVPLAVLAGMATAAAVARAFDPGAHAGAVLHLFSGATMLGAFFIATDPVSGAASDRGRVVFGAGIGVLTYLIRAHGVHADGFAFAVLLMNLAVPLIDRHSVPLPHGHART